MNTETVPRLKLMCMFENRRLTFQRCYDSLNRLALIVRMSVPGTEFGLRILVKDAWQPYRRVPRTRTLSLHHEGRALDITFGFVNEENRARWPVKQRLGILALWAINAGFDWVSYESHEYIHVSCRAGKSRL